MSSCQLHISVVVVFVNSNITDTENDMVLIKLVSRHISPKIDGR